jgi:hypothetical protein
MKSMTANEEGGLPVPPWLAEARELIGAFRASLLPIVPVLQSLAEAVSVRVREYQKLTDRWEQDAPTVLKDAIHAEGLIVPVTQMSLQDLVGLLELNRDRGAFAVVERIKQLYDEIFDGPGFMDGLEVSWAANHHLQRRLVLLRQALEAHKLRLFGVSVPALVAQFEGLVVDMIGHTGKMNFEQLKALVATLAASDTVTDGMLTSFVNDTFLEKFHHGLPTPPFSRHAVLHGADVDYATEVNSRTAILLVDHISSLGPRSDLSTTARSKRGRRV